MRERRKKSLEILADLKEDAEQELVSLWEWQPGQGQELGRTGLCSHLAGAQWCGMHGLSSTEWDLGFPPFFVYKFCTKASQLCSPLCHWYQCALENILAMGMSWSGQVLQVHRQVVALIQGFLEDVWASSVKGSVLGCWEGSWFAAAH